MKTNKNPTPADAELVLCAFLNKLIFFCSISIGLSCFHPSWAQEVPKVRLNKAQDFYQLGLFYGSPQENKTSLAIKNFQLATKSGHLKAMYALGWMYYFGKGVDKDYRKARNYFQQAAEKKLPEAQHMLGIMYSEGKGVKRDSDKAFQWTVKAAKNGNKAAQAILKAFSAPTALPAQ